RAAPVLCAHPARQARAGCRGAAPRGDHPSRAREPGVAKGLPRMTGDRVLRWCARSYAHLLSILRVRDSRERQAIREDGERLLEAARSHGPFTLAATWLA